MTKTYEFAQYTAILHGDELTVLTDGTEWARLRLAVTVDREGDAGTEEDLDTGVRTVEEQTEKDGSVTVRVCRGSRIWEEKTVFCRLDEEGFSVRAEVRGTGRVGKVTFLESRTADGSFGASGYEFGAYTVPFTDFFSREHRTHNVIEPFSFDLQIFCPPLYVFSFRHPETDLRFGLGLYGQDGDWNFIRYDFALSRRRPYCGFSLSTDFEGHRVVRETFRTPQIRAFFAPSDREIFRAYADRFRAEHPDLPRPRADIPDFWRGPIICGWQEQYVHAGDRTQFDADHFSRESVYRSFVDKVFAAGLRPKILIIDDKWQGEYGIPRPDPEKWPDLRGFIDDMKQKGLHTLLWYKLWAGPGLPLDETVRESDATPYGTMAFDESPYCDPSNPKWQARLRRTIHTLLSADEGCCNADGFKVDFAFMMPRGKKARSYSGEYGVELYREQMRLIYQYAKEEKPDCLINASLGHPYFTGLSDQHRLHDYDDAMRDYTAEMQYRRDLFDLAIPGLLIDCDSPCYGGPISTMRALRAQPSIGVPDLYRISGTEAWTFSEEDLAELRKIWEAYDRACGREPAGK